MKFLGRLTVKTSKRTDRPIEIMVHQNDSVHINDEYNVKSLVDNTEILGLDNATISNHAPDFTPEKVDIEGGEQMVEVSFSDGGKSATKYEVKLFIEVEEEFEI